MNSKVIKDVALVTVNEATYSASCRTIRTWPASAQLFRGDSSRDIAYFSQICSTVNTRTG